MNNLQKRKIVPSPELAEFLNTDESLDPLTFMSVLWTRLYQSGSVRIASTGERALRRRRRNRENAKRRSSAGKSRR